MDRTPGAGPERSSMFEFSAGLVDRVAALSPTLATFMGVPGHDDRWEDLGPEGHEQRWSMWDEARGWLLEQPAGDRWDALAREVMLDHCDEWMRFYDAQEQHFDLNHIASPPQLLTMALDMMPTTSAEERDRVVARLGALGQAFLGYQVTLEEGLGGGHTVARRQATAALRQAKLYAGESSPFVALAARCDRACPGARPALDRAVAEARQAYGGFAEFLEATYLPAATADDAVGRERYLRAAQRHLGLTLDLEETYAWGWGEVHRIEAEVARLAGRLRPGATVPAVIEALRRDPTLCAATADEFIDLMRQRQEQALAQLDGTHFDVPPPARQVDVKRAPPGGPPGAYYCQPGEGFSRPGAIWYSLEREAKIPYFHEISTAYHEGFPGHHLHGSVQVALADRLSRFQRLVASNSGHAEGWALYAEQLMHELGFLERPEFELGMLLCELVRAFRVVVDIGLHLGLAVPSGEPLHPGKIWNFQVAAETMERRAFLTSDTAASNVTRYLGWPGQAITYKVGQRVIFELRDERRAALGASFDLKAFHAQVVGAGSVGLGLLRRLVAGG